MITTTVNANALRLPFADGIAQTCVTSPPYYGLRDYGHADQIGLEKTYTQYVANIVAVMREVWRVLKDDGTLWLNLGDSYSGSGKGRNGDGYSTATGKQATNAGTIRGHLHKCGEGNGKPKDLLGIPWRVAFALQDDGWYLRSDIIWSKPNPMPESVTDRPTKAHEYVFLLAKQERYYYNSEAIKETAKPESMARMMRGVSETHKNVNGSPGQTPHSMNQPRPNRNDKQRGHSRRHAGFNDRWDLMTKEEQGANGRNKRTVWTVATHPYSGAHFATFPPDLIRPMVLAGSRPADFVLDPFSGAGTTAKVATELGRQFAGTEINRDYLSLATERTMTTIGMF